MVLDISKYDFKIILNKKEHNLDTTSQSANSPVMVTMQDKTEGENLEHDFTRSDIVSPPDCHVMTTKAKPEPLLYHHNDLTDAISMIKEIITFLGT